MQVFSTVLFVNGSPVGYQVSHQNNRFSLNPAENPSRDILPPTLYAQNVGGRWTVDGTGDQELIAQVIHDVRNSEFKIPHNRLSAAL